MYDNLSKATDSKKTIKSTLLFLSAKLFQLYAFSLRFYPENPEIFYF